MIPRIRGSMNGIVLGRGVLLLRASGVEAHGEH